MNSAFQLTIEGAPALALRSFESFEQSHLEAWCRVLAALAPGSEGPLLPDDLLGKRATLQLAPEGASRPEPRFFHGIVDAVELSAEGASFTLVPRVMVLGDQVDHRVFLDKDAVAIAAQLLREAQIPFDRRVGAPPAIRPQRVQAFEPTLVFLRRILAEEGISLWVEHGESEERVVIGDDASACPLLPGGALPYRPEEGLHGGEAVTALALEHRLTHDGAAVADYDPDHPAVDQSASVGDNHLPLFAYPGHHRSPAEGEARARLLLEAAESEGVILRGKTTCRHVAVGSVIAIEDAPRDDLDGRFRVIELHARGRDFGAAAEGMPRYEAAFAAIPVARPLRPRPERPRGLGGLQSMTVTGPSGSEIHTSASGQIKARFRWDRRSPDDDGSSTWVRPMQPALSGAFFLPRTGWEVLVGFDSDPVPTGDTPIELGRLIHAAAPPAEPLPAQKVRSSWGTESTPGGGKQNRLRFDDAAGNEGMHLDASKNYNERSENDKVVKITADDTCAVGGNHQSSVTLQQITSVGGAQRYDVGGNRDLTTVGVLAISAAGETVSVGGDRRFQVGGDYETKTASLARVVGAAENVMAIQGVDRHVSGASTLAVGGTWAEVGGASASMGVLGASTLSAGGPLLVRASNVSINASVLSERYAGAYQGRAGGKLTVKAPVIKLQAGGAFKAKGANVLFKASAKIVVQAGGVTITLFSGSIKVKGTLKGDSTSVVTTKEKVG